ncbi:MAG: 4'-phosphopantetheinyl transferase superfamily protein [Pantoea sp.]|uniref:4'-phosphopantetheinyl transferase family protein n=1 Tax=Pantoea septica TaxID=472695 RepID=UPI001C10D6A2|nr:4'-phosphopantetheinyl transferase superfamily protein [Pantoea septica]MBU5376150.1 4'-phosphopantetheinyl transferase superfamily protein [Pantoea septica]MDU5836318.1 4'-phosphopantetheinyl transferase superfamily protein [Pantoea sp.]MDU6440065.1 4'-phosphopantetheinyl transferase superfamily protein [Pantoea sp.]
MHPQLISLPPPEGGFIRSAHLRRGDVLLAQARFDLTLYDDSFSARWNLPLPPAVRQAVKKRRAEYLASRWLARAVMASLGIPDFLLQNHSDRSPIWPPGIQASLSHTDGAAALAVTQLPLCIGVDIESVMNLRTAEETAALLMSAQEKVRLRALPLPFSQAATLLFSLKESLYKALWPQLHQPMDFPHASLLEADIAAGKAVLVLNHSFSAAFAVGTRLEAEFQLETARVLTLLTCPAVGNKKPALSPFR